MKLPLSLILIAHNEAHHLERCLNAIAPLAHEIIAVINDCTDNTETILKAYNAKIYNHPWQGMANQKNLALSYATQGWILNLDADEEVTPAMVDAIKKFIQNPSTFSGVSFPRKIWFCGRWIKHGDWYPNSVLRLFKKDCAQFTGDKDHEHVSCSGNILHLKKAHLIHHSFKNLGDVITKYPRFAKAHLDWQVKKSKRFSIFSTLFRSGWRFFRCYILRLGFLDGYPGLFIALNQSFYTLYRYSHLYEFEHKKVSPQYEICDLK